MKVIEGGVTAASGFKASSCEANIKYKNRTDMAMVYSEYPAVSAGTYTTNVVKAACVQWDMELTKSDRNISTVVINSGIANACTGEEGFEACRRTAMAVSEVLPVEWNTVAVASTGVIGMQLPVDRLEAGVKKLAAALSDTTQAGTDASKAIMTTDTINKEIAVQFEIGGKQVTLGGMSKGSGMIHPNMCTMLGFLTTDIAIEKALLQEALSDVVKDTFNMITVDGDTSTNDSLIIMANGIAGNDIISEKNDDYNTFHEALFYVCRHLARTMAGDGEGATALFEAKVINAKSVDDARLMARSVVGSNLSKAAIYGHDANFGRFLCAMGYSGAIFDQNDVELYFESKAGKMMVFDHGTPVAFDEDKATEILSQDEVTVLINMNEGDSEATAWGCDLTHKYVDINADYRS